MIRESRSDINSANLQVVRHHIYEYKKGVRYMVLHTMLAGQKDEVEKLLKKRGICFFTQNVTLNKINIFFGNPDCIEVIKSFGNISLSEYSPEQDFILGILLGYDSDIQCKRYLSKKDKVNPYPKPYVACQKEVLLSKSVER
nr:DUF2023 family protein [uncultured Draconibacterium sp.]